MSKKKNEEIVEQEYNMIRTVRTILIVLTSIAMFYLFTSLFITKDLELIKEQKEEEPVSIQYSEIIAGEIFNRSEEEYYVIFYNSEDDAADLINYYINYSFLPNIKMYKIDLSSSFNSYILGGESNLNTSSLSDLKVNDVTLLKIKEGKNTLQIEGLEKIIEHFE